MGSTYFYWGSSVGNSYSVSIYEGKHMDFYRDETSAPRLLEYMGMNTDAYFPRPYDSYEGGKNFQTSTKYLVNGAYVRLKRLQDGPILFTREFFEENAREMIATKLPCVFLR
ncbi:MAG: hypothetical protein ACLVEJ_15445 [Parabacteroides sp.]